MMGISKEDGPSSSFLQAMQDESHRFKELYLWLEKSMPKVFFQEVKEEWIHLVVHTLMGFKVQDYFSQIHLKNAAIALIIDSPEADVRILVHYPMYGIKSYTTYVSRDQAPFLDIDGYLRIAIIQFTEAIEKPALPLVKETKEELRALLLSKIPELSDEQFDQLMIKIDPPFLRKLSRDLQVRALELFYFAQTRDRCQLEVIYEENWKEKDDYSMHVVLAWRNTPKHNFLYRLARMIHQHNLVMHRVNATYTDPYTTQSILMLSFGLHGSQKEAAWEATDIADFLQELATLKYFGSIDLIDATFVETKLLRGNLGNFLRTCMNFIHQIMVNVDPNFYSLENICEGLCQHPELTIKLCEAFENKFHPQRVDFQRYQQTRDEFTFLVNQLDTGDEYQDTRRKNILLQGMNFVHHTLKSNFYQKNKTALCFRLDPLYLEYAPFERKKNFPELPFAIFFMKGMHFLGFHIRFKDLSRGGLRTIFPEKKEKIFTERNTVFSECYNLAYTQHKKNKDIPEGGAKAVIFLKPYERLNFEAEIYTKELNWGGFNQEEITRKIEVFKKEQKLEYLYQTQRAFITSFLSLLNCEIDGTLRESNIVDYLHKPEYIYLGPDENLHDSMIEWIAMESKKIHYRPGGAFISGKPFVGINHKQYGVTSLGVNVYMHEVLKFLKIDPDNDSFTIKMTGGPDGDVAGNQIKNLYTYYPRTAKLVALTDVSGTIYDPLGLDLETCFQLFKAGKSIRFYPPEKLSPSGFLLDRFTRREPTPYIQQTLCWKNKDGNIIADWLSGNEMNALFRNNVHQTKADIFIPAGGRPKTLRDTNYKDFLDKSGLPTSKAIIEGANLYLSPWARRYLEELGVIIIKDSSANKGGVICSSYEILCSLTLNDEEFLKYKEDLVQEILVALKERALEEATLLLKTYQTTQQYLTDISDLISERINGFTDQLLNYLEKISLPSSTSDHLMKCFLSYCPKTLRERFEGKLLEQIPENHKKAVIACSIASRLVYKRGLSWEPSIVDILPLLLENFYFSSP